jgi:hypothetical protein
MGIKENFRKYGWVVSILIGCIVIAFFVGNASIPEPKTIYGCPSDMKYTSMTMCKDYGAQFIPTDQNVEHIVQNYPKANCGQDQKTGLIICMECVKDINVGWLCSK